jgi:hypothetical protein
MLTGKDILPKPANWRLTTRIGTTGKPPYHPEVVDKTCKHCGYKAKITDNFIKISYTDGRPTRYILSKYCSNEYGHEF